MVKKTIQIYCRLKPSTSSASELFGIDEDGDGNPLLAFSVPKDLSSGLINNKRDTYRFRFDRIFDQNTKQEHVFDHISKPVIENVLSGYNGTIFAYGQTGSGKTFTITGGAERYADRGIIPRSLSYIFKYYESNSNFEYSTHISYLEIYNDAGYDLLDPRHEAAKLEDLPKVNLLEDRDGNIHLRNLSVHVASNEEDALNLLFLGDTNRMIAETPMNQASTRSHCIFTIHVTTKDPTTATIRRSKLHLVDLAGSERVSKTGVTGTLLSEAKYINVSLHFLEQVIIALSEKSRSHIPYRNSMMTSVLRDSLGGNCMTTMIATCSVEKRNIDESISTCRFAQRVAMIKNDATLNEEIDPKLVIERLKREIQQLKDELAMANGTEYDEELTEEIRKSLWDTVRIYLEDNDPESTLSVGADIRKINCCYGYMKEFYRKKIPDNESSLNSARQETPALDRADNNYLSNVTEVRKLKELILQRDNEINILVSMLKKERQKPVRAEGNTGSFSNGNSKNAELSRHEMRSQVAASNYDIGNDTGYRDGYRKETINESEPYRREHSLNHAMKSRESSQQREESSEERRTTASSDGVDPRNRKNESSQMSVARQEAFDSFKRTYRHNQTIQEQKQALKEKYAEARSLGEQVNESRKSINVLKSRIEQQRVRHSMQGLTGDAASNEPDAEEMRLRELLNREKATYKVAFTNLKGLKTEIEHLQHLLEKAKVQLLKDFELWWTEAASIQSLTNQVPSYSKPAWKTPPVTPDKPLHEILRSARQGHTKSTIGDLPSYSRDVRDTVTKYEESQDESRVDSGRMASRLRAEAQLASSLFSGEDARKTALNQLQEKSKQNSLKQHSSFHSQHSGIHLTGDSKTDADIIAFMKARQNLLQNKGRS